MRVVDGKTLEVEAPRRRSWPFSAPRVTGPGQGWRGIPSGSLADSAPPQAPSLKPKPKLRCQGADHASCHSRLDKICHQELTSPSHRSSLGCLYVAIFNTQSLSLIPLPSGNLTNFRCISALTVVLRVTNPTTRGIRPPKQSVQSARVRLVSSQRGALRRDSDCPSAQHPRQSDVPPLTC
jgi:hypothetical protein